MEGERRGTLLLGLGERDEGRGRSRVVVREGGGSAISWLQKSIKNAEGEKGGREEGRKGGREEGRKGGRGGREEGRKGDTHTCWLGFK